MACLLWFGSSKKIRSTPSCCTFTATISPLLRSRARCTCAIDAEANGSGSNSEKIALRTSKSAVRCFSMVPWLFEPFLGQFRS